MKSKPVPYDVAVIGAGINGAGIARDAALRGLSVVVVDQADLCSGTSAIASRVPRIYLGHATHLSRLIRPGRRALSILPTAQTTH